MIKKSVIQGRGTHAIPNSLKTNLEFLQRMLEVVLDEYSPQLRENFEKIVKLTTEARTNEEIFSYETVYEFIENLTVESLQELTRALTCYFHLSNLAEELYRVSKLNTVDEDWLTTHHTHNILGDAYIKLEKEIGTEEAQTKLNELCFHPVLTAHPTEARRRAVNGKIRRITSLLSQKPHLKGIQLVENERKILGEIDALFRTSPIGSRKPSPLDESDVVTSIFDTSLLESVTLVYRRLDDYLQLHSTAQKYSANDKDFARKLGVNKARSSAFFTLGSWIGSDRDGNPNVVASVTRQVAQKFSAHIITVLADRATLVGRNLTLKNDTTPGSEELIKLWNKLRDLCSDINNDGFNVSIQEPHRAVMLAIAKRLEATKQRNSDYAYTTSSQLLLDLRVVQDSLIRANALRAAYGPLQSLIWQVETFGFHLASMEIRQHSQVHREALEDIEAQGISSQELKARTIEVLDTFQAIGAIQRRYGFEAANRYIVSFTQCADDISNVFKLAKYAEVEESSVAIIDVVPLFETLDDLTNSVDILDQMLKIPEVQERLNSNNRRLEVMLGYSDSSKDVGPVAATFALHKTQASIANWAEKNNIKLVLFHGRGGALGRGGGPANRAVYAQPKGSVDGTFKLTEQGETIMARYGNPDIAVRHIESVAAATLMHSAPSVKKENQEQTEKYNEVIEKLSQYSKESFHKFVKSKDFASWFDAVTPLEEIGLLPIGSRPAKRGLSTKALEDLRAIPWVFAWSQARINLAAWYGFGSSCKRFAEEYATPKDPDAGIKILQSAYSSWNLFATLVDNIEMSIAKTDDRIATKYLSLSDRDDLANAVIEELKLTNDFVTKINKSLYPLENRKILGQAIQVRGPYVDSLSLLQFFALKKLRQSKDSMSEKEIEDYQYLLLCAVNGVAAGLQNTG
ncbi:MAG: phosphoenolpyruvate carboxylase [Candidatus Ancillula sp.]|jgi:phosphoenolpyruvate carboxylase|nr:phosphoenolpyruvate carboxylase [Candidatus Ancillula sp.]